MTDSLSGDQHLPGDVKFGPQLEHEFDFTLKFEHVMFSIVPNCVFIFVSIICIYRFLHKPIVVHRGVLWWPKLATSAAILITEVYSLALWFSYTYRTRYAVAATLCSCVASLLMLVLADAEHRRSLRASGWLSFYLGIYSLLSAVKARSFFLRPNLHHIAQLQILALCLIGVMLLLGEVPKRGSAIDSRVRTAASFETFAGFWTRVFYLWVLPTLLTGAWRLLTPDDLGNLEADLQAPHLAAKFAPIWAKANKSSSNALFKTLVWTMLGSACLTMVPRIILLGFSYSQPYLLERVVSMLENEHNSNKFKYGLIGAATLVYAGLMISRAAYNYLWARMCTRVRAILVSSIYIKTLRLDHERAKQMSAVTLMSTDADGVARNIRSLYELIANLLELAVGIALLSTRVGLACILLVAPTAVLSTISAIIGRQIAPSQIAWNRSIEERVTKTSAFLRQIRAIKMTGQGPAAIDFIQSLREAEMKESRKYRLLQGIIFANAMLIYCLTPISVMGGYIFWTRSGGTLQPSEVFTILSIVAIVSTPLSKLVASYPSIAATFGRMQRIQDYLLLVERRDLREVLEASDDTLPEAAEAGNSESQKPSETDTTDGSSSNDHAVQSDNVCLSASETSGAIIRRSSFWVPRQKVTIIVGRTGFGKSTLLRGLLGEAIMTQGVIKVASGFIAYCDQDIWLQNISIRQTVVGDGDYDVTWYRSVMRACCLLQEVEALPYGDQTMIGSDGLRVSGGQKGRLSLARAVYALAPIVFIDDIFSAMDDQTANDIFERLLGQHGLLRNICTVVLATSGRFLPRADHLLFLNASGSVSMISDKRLIPSYAHYIEGDAATAVVASSNSNQVAEVPQEETAEPSLPLESTGSAELAERERFRQRGDSSLYLIYFKSVPKHSLLLWLVVLGLFAVSERSPEIYMRIWVGNYPNNMKFFIGYGLLGVACGVLGLSHVYTFWLKLTPKASENLHKNFLEIVMNATYQFITSTDAGYLLNRFSGDMTIMSQELPNSIYLVIYDSYLVITDIAIISLGAKNMTIGVPILFGILWGLQWFYLRTSRQVRFMDLETNSPLYTHFTETSRGLRHIRAFLWESRFTDKFYALLDASQKPDYYLMIIQQWLTAAMDSIGMLLAISLVTLALKYKNTSPSGTGLALLNLITFSEQLGFLMKDWTGLETSLSAIARLDDFVKNTPVERDAIGAAALHNSWPDDGSIEFRDVDAGYGPRGHEPFILRQLSFRLEPGQKAAIVGATGLGKTSIFLTLLNLLEYTGTIFIGGENIAHLPRQELRARITTVCQDSVEFPGTLRDNLLPPNKMRPTDSLRRVDDDAIRNVLRVVQLLETVEYRGGLNAPFGEFGFSYGEKQLIALARAIIHSLEFRTKFVLLDEATGALDTLTRSRMQSAMEVAFTNHTVITIAHRMDTIRGASWIYDMNRSVIYS